MRRLLGWLGAILTIFHVALGGIVVAGRVTNATACLQYRTFNNAEMVYGVIDAYSGVAMVNRGYDHWTYVYTNERYSITAKRHNMGYELVQQKAYVAYDLAIIPSNSASSPITLQEDVLIPVASSQYLDADLYQFLAVNLIIGAKQIALHWLDHSLDSFLTVMNEDGSNHRTTVLNDAMKSSIPVAWAADDRYLLMRQEQPERFKPYLVLDAQTLKPVALLAGDDAKWQTAAWSPTQSMLAAIRPAMNNSRSAQLTVVPLQLVLFSPSDGTTYRLDLPDHFYAQEIIWSPNGQGGVVAGIHLISDNGSSTAKDSKNYVFFSATGKLTSGMVQGILQPQFDERLPMRFGTWTLDGSTWLYLRESGTTPTGLFELVAVDMATLAEQVLERRIASEWWAEVFNDNSPPYPVFGITPPAVRQDVVMITRNVDDRLTLDLLDTQTMKRTTLVADAERLNSPRGQSTTSSGSAFRLVLDKSSSVIFDALMAKDGEVRFVWSALDGSNHHELPIDADSFEIDNGWTFRQPILLYHVRHRDQSTIGVINVNTGTQTDLLKSLTYISDQFNAIPHGEGSRAVFTTTNILTGPADLYLSALDGKFTRLLATLILPDPVWMADGDQLAYMKVDNGYLKVEIVDQDGQPVRELTTNIKLVQNFQGLSLRGWTKCPT